MAKHKKKKQKKTTVQKLTRQLHKLVRKHGPEVALELATAAIAAIAVSKSDDAADEARGAKKKLKKKLRKAQKEGRFLPQAALSLAAGILPTVANLPIWRRHRDQHASDDQRDDDDQPLQEIEIGR